MTVTLDTSWQGGHPVHQIAMSSKYGSSPFCSVRESFGELNAVLRDIDTPAFTEFKDTYASTYHRLLSDVRETISLLSGDDPVSFYNTLEMGMPCQKGHFSQNNTF